ncbi:hypothetical protein [Burkholderia ubonensis]|uniref:hypothetical protein n=1 Tax=Burkholderia ubonensis TaxID=101571 RepID=UPI0018E0047A|nr:hypothetical protein [Burkholderia ubonensis]
MKLQALASHSATCIPFRSDIFLSPSSVEAASRRSPEFQLLRPHSRLHRKHQGKLTASVLQLPVHGRDAPFHVGREKTAAIEIVWDNQTLRFFNPARQAM